MSEMSMELSYGLWSEEKANAWFGNQPWPCGFNYVPSNAISYTEMWMEYSFDPDLIDKEMTLAEEVGFNCARVVLPYVVWQAEPSAFKKRLDRFLSICEKHGVKVMFALFDDCAFGPITDPVFGKQPEVVEGWYANGWTPSPGHKMIRDSACWPKLLAYAEDLVASFKDDLRVWIWDIYNEPSIDGTSEATRPFIERLAPCVKACNPTQPTTIGLWIADAKLNALIHAVSDIVSFHNYSTAENLETQIAHLKSFDRPIVCTEWLNRNGGSSVASCLPVFKRNGVGAMHWGLVNGRTQTNLNWRHRPGDQAPKFWQHDIYRPDHSPYDPIEIELFKTAIRQGAII